MIKPRGAYVIACLFFTPVVADVLWKPSDITYEIKQSHPALGIGYTLELNQSLRNGETGWTQSRFDIPEHWKDADVRMVNEQVMIWVASKKYYIDASNFGCLGFEILSAGEVTGPELEQIWVKCASDP